MKPSRGPRWGLGLFRRTEEPRCLDQDTADLLTGIVVEFEKHAWFLRASLAE